MKVHGFLQGVRVIDLSQYIPGPFASRQLADLGAEVIKIEPPAGDPMRHFMHQSSDTMSPVYRHLNRGKKICRTDLKSEDGKERLRKLLTGADILLESYRPGVLQRLGFDRATLDELNPTLIHCALSGYGQNGPYRLRAGHDINYCAGSSILALNGSESQPMMSYPLLADHAGAMQASTMMLAALHGRHHQTGSTYIDISMLETCLSWQYLPILTSQNERAGDIVNGGAACYNIYRSSEGLFLSLGAIETAFWKNFCTAVEHPEWIARQFETMPQGALIAELEVLFAEHKLEHWNTLLDSVDCCYQPLYFPEQLARHPQLMSRGAISNNGPRHPAWVNQQAIDIEEAVFEIDAGKLNWLPSAAAE
ncbi:MAG: alpha-methylacyl-CoA racemase [Planctomycetota bacterium]|jgi:alpha-methylacyl-CoA racemase